MDNFIARSKVVCLSLKVVWKLLVDSNTFITLFPPRALPLIWHHALGDLG